MARLTEKTQQDQIRLLEKKIMYLETELTAYKTQNSNNHSLSDDYENFIANFNHELLTPLNSILGLLELSLDMTLSSKLREYLEQAQLSCQQLKKFAGDALTLTRLDTHQLILEQQDFNLHDVFEALIAHYVRAAAIKKIDLNLIIPAHLPYALIGDSYKLQQVLGHLLENAIKFSESGEINLSVERVSSIDQKICLEFSVQDSGIGISEVRIKDIFKTFYQTDSTPSRKYNGAGIGLSLCKQLVNLMQGSISVSSHPGQGSHFIFDACFGLQTNQSISQCCLPDKGSPWRTLVVDLSDKSVYEAIEPILNDFQFKADFLHTSSESKNAFKQYKECQQTYELLIVDWEVLERKNKRLIKAIENCSLQTKTIVLIPFGQSRYLDEYHNIRIDKFVKKPITRQGLFRAIDKLFTEPKVPLPHMERLPSDNQNKENFSTIEHSILQKHLQNLADLLEHGDHIAAEKLVTKLQNIAQDQLLELLHDQISEFDFDDALNSLHKLKKRWHIA
ncbi:MAG: HAMP domain-containing sensor histidine kinase [Gammaproteobacteria bacterium]|nr:HAMP domain-containing sensor histidine kinase [Gammaproteobacteria bacterium]